MSASKISDKLIEIRELIDNAKFSEGLAQLESIFQDEALLATAHYLAAFCLHNLRTNFKQAIHHYNLSLEYGFNEFWVRYNRGSLHRDVGDLESAYADLERANALNPQHKHCMQLLEELSYSKKDLQTSYALNNPVLVFGIPECGTNILRSILTTMLGENNILPSKIFNIGLVTPEYLRALPVLANRVYVGHLWYSNELFKLFSSVPKILLIRDPRDYVVSYANLLDRTAESLAGQGYWDRRQWDEKLSAIIFGMNAPGMQLASAYQTFLNYSIKWRGSNTLIIRYEDIIGSKNNGDDSTVKKTIRSILNFIGLNLSEEEVSKINEKIPTTINTLASDKVGSWLKEFNRSHVMQMKTAAPGLVSALGYEPDENWDLVKTASKKSPRTFTDVQVLPNTIPNALKRFNQLRQSVSGKSELENLVDVWALNIFIETEQFSNALPILRHLTGQAPADPAWNYLLGFCLQMLNREQKKALHHYNLALQNGYDEFWVRYNRGALLLKNGDVENSLKDLERAVMLKPENLTAKEMLKKAREMTKKVTT